MQALSRRVTELEARIAPDLMKQSGDGFKPPSEAVKESNKADFVYEGDLK
jgi:hypothetical protein